MDTIDDTPARGWVPSYDSPAAITLALLDQRRSDLRENVADLAIAVGEAARCAKFLRWELDSIHRASGDRTGTKERAADFARFGAGLPALLAHVASGLEQLDLEERTMRADEAPPGEAPPSDAA